MKQPIWRETILDYFNQILSIPHPSGHEEELGRYLMDFASKHKLVAKCDRVGNILISKPATPGYEKSKKIILQSHQDMVCEKEPSINHNFMSDPITTYIEDGWLKAQGTTLGADDGIGMAMTLAILANNELIHGPIDALFTVSEETGLIGAFNLDATMVDGEILINLDSEDEGEIFIGCAGGITSNIQFEYVPQSIPDNYFPIKITIGGLHGGHSGDDIDKGYANANKLLSRFLYNSINRYNMKLCSLNGGKLHNAIPRDASALIAVPNADKESIRIDFNLFAADIETEFKATEPNIFCHMESTDESTHAIDDGIAKQLIYALHAVPNGVYAMSMELKGLVETSSNLASIRTNPDNITIVASHRSSKSSALYSIRDSVAATFMLAGATVTHNDGYPAWQPNIESELLHIATSSYKQLFNKEAKVRAIHAGLECGLFLKMNPKLEMISIGPTLRGVHSPSESLDIATIDPVMTHLVRIIELIASKQ